MQTPSIEPQKAKKHFAYDLSGRINICKSCTPAILNGAELHIEKVPRELELI